MNFRSFCQVFALITLIACFKQHIANADLANSNNQGSEKVQIYTKLFNTDPLDPLLERAEILALLEKGRQLEESTVNGGRTTLEEDLIKLGTEIDSDRCLDFNLFPMIAWNKHRFSEAPSIFNYLEQIEEEQLDLCRESFSTDYAMTIVKLNPRTRVELRDLTKKVGNMGVYLNDIKVIPERRLIDGVVAYIIDYRKQKHEKPTQIGLDGQPIIELKKQAPVLQESSALSKETMDEFFEIYKKLTKNCVHFSKTIGPLMQVAQAVGEQVLDLDSTLRDLEKDNVVCRNLVSRPHLVSKMGELFLEKLNKQRKSQTSVQLDSALKSSQPIKKSIFGSFKLKFH